MNHHNPDFPIENDNGLQAFTTLGQFLEQDDWHPQQLGDKHIYRMGFSGSNGQTTCYAQIRVDLEQFIFYVIAPVKAPEKVRQAIADFITRANYGLRIGNFEMDFDDGEVRYKSSLDFEDATLAPALIKNAIYPAVQTMDRYLPGLMGVIYGDKLPAKVIAEIEDSHES
ncbi:MAG: YbjN domain-containing protein [Chloroflexi bacterium]|nr:YbjN domain-containing protein [Chloroflexota bacterium]